MAYQPAPNETSGNKKETQVSDDDMQGLMLKILKELQKLNIHMESITDEHIDNTEVE